MARQRQREKKLATGIYRRADGRIKIRTYIDGKQREKTLEEGTTLNEAKRIRAEMMGDPGSVSSPEQPRRTTVADFAETWVRTHVSRKRASTRKSYVDCLVLHILPRIGHIPVEDMRRSVVDELARDFEEAEKPNGDLYAYATIATWWRTAMVLLRDMAVEYGIPDPTQRIQAPQKRAGGDHQEKRTLNPQQLGALLRAVQQRAPQRYAEVATLAFTGCRWGELVALRWSDIGPSGAISVELSHVLGETNSTKTDEPRIVLVPDLVLEALDAHRQWMMRSQHPGLASGLCFPSDVGTHRTHGALTKTLRAAAKACGIDQTVSALVLRRTYNTILRRAGVEDTVVRAQMGHATEEMGRHYNDVSAWTPEQREAAKTMERLVTQR